VGRGVGARGQNHVPGTTLRCGEPDRYVNLVDQGEARGLATVENVIVTY
jgi:hypothetical protein